MTAFLETNYMLRLGGGEEKDCNKAAVQDSTLMLIYPLQNVYYCLTCVIVTTMDIKLPHRTDCLGEAKKTLGFFP